MNLPAIWFFLLGALLAGYAVLDGFDLGVGMLHICARNEEERQTLIDTVGPIWDGNEVWLVTFGGGLFAAFPEGYATLLSAFYLPAVLILLSLIFRAASLEFRVSFPHRHWRKAWDAGFFLSSLLAAGLFGVAVGNGIIGLPLNRSGVFVGSPWVELRPYPLLVGLLTITLFALHGALYLRLRIAEPTLRERIELWVQWCWRSFLVVYIAVSAYTVVTLPNATANFRRLPWASALVLIHVLCIAAMHWFTRRGQPGKAFLASGATVVVLVLLMTAAVWPNMVPASNNPGYAVSIYQAASSTQTLKIMLLFACLGAPLVLTYTTLIYWNFWRPLAGRTDELLRE